MKNNTVVFKDKFQNTPSSYRVLSFIVIICTGLITTLITSCSMSHDEKLQNANLHLSSPPHRTFKQTSENEYQPSAYFTCGDAIAPCPYTSNIGKEISLSKINRTKKKNHFNFKGEHREKNIDNWKSE